MNVREHIEAGHYVRDEKGRALVPIRAGSWTATIYATDFPGERPIVGHINYGSSQEIGQWSAAGLVCSDGTVCNRDLLTPPPRKAPVVGWARVALDGTIRKFATTYGEAIDIGVTAETVDKFFGDQMVELKGEREVPR